MSPHRPLHQWCVWCWEKVLVQLWWFSCFQDNRIRNQVQSREKWIHILLPQQVSCLLHAEHDIKKKLRKFIHLYGRMIVHIVLHELQMKTLLVCTSMLFVFFRDIYEDLAEHFEKHNTPIELKWFVFWTIRGYVHEIVYWRYLFL